MQGHVRRRCWAILYRNQPNFCTVREGIAGLLRDKTRKPNLLPLPVALVDRVVALTITEPPGKATPWTGRAIAAATGVSLSSVQRIWAVPSAAPSAAAQAVAGSGLCRQAARRGRAVYRSASPQPGAFGRREVENSGPRPHAAGPADEEGSGPGR